MIYVSRDHWEESKREKELAAEVCGRFVPLNNNLSVTVSYLGTNKPKWLP